MKGVTAPPHSADIDEFLIEHDFDDQEHIVEESSEDATVIHFGLEIERFFLKECLDGLAGADDRVGWFDVGREREHDDFLRISLTFEWSSILFLDIGYSLKNK